MNFRAKVFLGGASWTKGLKPNAIPHFGSQLCTVMLYLKLFGTILYIKSDKEALTQGTTHLTLVYIRLLGVYAHRDYFSVYRFYFMGIKFKF